jgi:hypothetical protein
MAAVSFGIAPSRLEVAIGMTLNDLTGLLAQIVLIYLAYRQNEIFKRQNAIFAAQAGVPMAPSETAGAPVLVRRYWPMLAMALLVLLNGAVVAYRSYAEHHPSIPEFETRQDMVIGHGLTGRSCFMTVNGKTLVSRSVNYKLALGCFIYDGSQDMLDAPNMQISNLYDITEGTTNMIVNWGDAYDKYLSDHHAVGITTALLNVPNGVQITQFTTLRQARSLGVKIPVVAVAKRSQ